MNKNDNEGSFVSHLVELRKRLINSLIFLFVFLMAFWAIIFLATVIPYMIFVWAKEGKLESEQIPS